MAIGYTPINVNPKESVSPRLKLSPANSLPYTPHSPHPSLSPSLPGHHPELAASWPTTFCPTFSLTLFQCTSSPVLTPLMMLESLRKSNFEAEAPGGIGATWRRDQSVPTPFREEGFTWGGGFISGKEFPGIPIHRCDIHAQLYVWTLHVVLYLLDVTNPLTLPVSLRPTLSWWILCCRRRHPSTARTVWGSNGPRKEERPGTCTRNPPLPPAPWLQSYQVRNSTYYCLEIHIQKIKLWTV